MDKPPHFPFNSLIPNSLQPDFLESLRFTGEDLATIQTLGEFVGRQQLFHHQTPDILESLTQVARIESTESSNRIEGIEAPHAQIERIVLHRSEPRNRSEQEIAGYRDALALIHDNAPDMPPTPGLILQLHETIYRYLPGQGGHWKTTNNEIVERNPKGEILKVRFRPTSAVVTPQAMDDLCERFRSVEQGTKPDPLVSIPLAVLDFLCILPFRDGNGRSARLLTLLLLYRSGYEVGRFISLERLIEESKTTYYETLEASSQNWHDARHDPLPWLRYFWGVLIRAYREFEEKVGDISTFKGSKSERVRQAVLRQVMPFSISEIERLCPGISRETVRNVLRELKKAGKIQSTGKGRGARWALTT